MTALFSRSSGMVKVTFAVLTAVLLFSLSPASAEEGYVTGLKTYPLRENPQYSDPPVSRLQVGAKVTVLEKSSGWIKVEVDGKTGWMSASVIGADPPPGLKLGPLKKELAKTSSTLHGLKGENMSLQAEVKRLKAEVDTLNADLKKSRDTLSGRKNYQRLSGMALGGGLVIFGWIAGYALASASRRKPSKYQID